MNYYSKKGYWVVKTGTECDCCTQHKYYSKHAFHLKHTRKSLQLFFLILQSRISLGATSDNSTIIGTFPSALQFMTCAWFSFEVSSTSNSNHKTKHQFIFHTLRSYTFKLAIRLFNYTFVGTRPKSYTTRSMSERLIYLIYLSVKAPNY